MEFSWAEAFSEGEFAFTNERIEQELDVATLPRLKEFLDAVQIRYCLLRAYEEQDARYPLVDSRDLMPPFECELWEYKDLPGFSMIAFDRELESFSEIFQYDILHPVVDVVNQAKGDCCPLENHVTTGNMQTIMARLPKKIQTSFRDQFHREDVTSLHVYPALLPYLVEMDRAQVFARDPLGQYHLMGVFASFPSDFDGELKRFGLQIGKFKMGDNALYERNRMFVNQFLMELYGFPVASERRTSSAVFARRLHKLGERFMVRTLGQSDRVLSTIWNDGTSPRRYPKVEKVALVKVDPERTDLIEQLDRAGCFVDRQRLVVLLRVVYKQHSFHATNIRQDRALSVATQEVIHPLTGKNLSGFSVIRDSSTMLLRLNDIVRGEYVGRMIYHRSEVVESTETAEKRLKVLHAWLVKNQRRIIGYSEEFYAGVTRVLDGYLNSAEVQDALGTPLGDVVQEVRSVYAYIRQARRLHELADIAERKYKGRQLSYLEMLDEAVKLLHNLKFDLANYFDTLIDPLIEIVEKMLDDRYLCRMYVERSEPDLTPRGKEVRKAYFRLVSLFDEIKAIRKSRRSSTAQSA